MLSLRNKSNRLEELFIRPSEAALRPAPPEPRVKPTLPDITRPALCAGEAPPSEFAGWWTAFVTLLIKEVLRFARIWIQTILPPAVTTALYFVIFGKLLGAQLPPPMDGIGYPQYIAPGLIVLAISPTAMRMWFRASTARSSSNIEGTAGRADAELADPRRPRRRRRAARAGGQGGRDDDRGLTFH